MKQRFMLLRGDWLINTAKKVIVLLFIVFLMVGDCSSFLLVCAERDTVNRTKPWKEYRITKELADQYSPRIFGDKLVWVDERNGNEDIYMLNLSTGKETLIVKNPYETGFIDIYQNKIVWMAKVNGNWDIYLYDLTLGKDFQITDEPHGQQFPRIHGNVVVWLDNRSGNWDIYLYDLPSGEEKPIRTNLVEAYGWLDIWVDKVVYFDSRSGNGDIYLYNISTNVETKITDNPWNQSHPFIYKDKIIWDDYRNDPDHTDTLFLMDIYMYNLSTGEETLICGEEENQLKQVKDELKKLRKRRTED